MKKVCKFRKFLALALAVAMSVSVYVPVFAAEDVLGADDQPTAAMADISGVDNGGIELYGGETGNLTISNNYRTVINTKNKPIQTLNYKVTSSGYNGWVYQINIICFNADGSIAKEFRDASGVMASGTLKIQKEFKLMNVTRIDVEITPRLSVTTPLGYNMKFDWQ